MSDSDLRHILLLQLLPRREPGATTVELRDRLAERGFSIHLRSVQRDLDRLSSIFGFTHDEGSPPRWFWPSGSQELSIPAQDPVSALSWQLIEQYLLPVLPPAIQHEADGTFRAAREVLTHTHSQQFRRWRARVRLLPRGMPLKPPAIRAEVLDAVHTSLMEGQQLRATYKVRGAENAKTMGLHPLGLVIRESLYYLIATANDYENPVQFALHRLSRAEVLPERVREPKGFSLDDYISDGGFLYPQGKPITLVARFDAYTAQHLIESPLAPQQTARELEDVRVEIKAPVLNSQQLLWWLMGFGEKVEVMAPKALRRELGRQYRMLAERYAR